MIGETIYILSCLPKKKKKIIYLFSQKFLLGIINVDLFLCL